MKNLSLYDAESHIFRKTDVVFQKSNLFPLRVSTVLPCSKRCSAAFPLKAGVIRAMWTYLTLMQLCCAYEPHGNVVEICNGIRFDFYPGLP